MTTIGRKSTSNLATAEAGGEVEETQGKPKPPPASTPPAWTSESSMAPPNAPVIHRAKGAFGRLVIDELAKEHRAYSGFDFGPVSGTVMLSEEVALEGSASYRQLVASDARRSKHAIADPSRVWVKSRLRAGASVGLPLGAAALGFNGSVEISSIASQPRQLGEAVIGEARSMWLPLTAEGVVQMKAPPGTEWAFRGQYGASLGNAGPDTDYSTSSLMTGAAAGASYQNIYTKNVKILEDGKVFVLLGKHEGPSIGAALGVHVSTLGAGSRDSAASLGEGTESPSQDRRGNIVDRKTSVTAAIYG